MVSNRSYDSHEFGDCTIRASAMRGGLYFGLSKGASGELEEDSGSA
jgi:hypothetical protein